MNRQSSILFAMIAALVAAEAGAIEKGACLVQSTSYMDTLLNPVKGGDESFFSSPSGPPNAHLILDTSYSMVDWPVQLCGDQNAQTNPDGTAYTPPAGTVDAAGRGCGCRVLEELRYDPLTAYPPEIDNINSNTYYSEWFKNNKVYQVPTGNYMSDIGGAGDTVNDNAFPTYYGFNIGNGTEPGGEIWGTAAGTTATAITDACAPASQVGQASRPSNEALCRSCLATKGYYLEPPGLNVNYNACTSPGVPAGCDGDTSDAGEPGSNAVMRRRMVGNFLNFFSQRYLMARNVGKQVVRDIRRTRLSLSRFASSTESVVVEPWNPTCSSLDNNASWDSNRQSVVNGMGGLRFDVLGTPLSASLLMAGFQFNNIASAGYATAVPYDQIFGSRAAWKGAMGFSDATITSYVEKGTNDNQRSVCFSCTFNAVILLTDGEPNASNDDDVPTPVGDGGNELVWADCPNCDDSDLDEVSKMMWERDMRLDNVAGGSGPTSVQKIATYTISFGLADGSWGNDLLRHTAEVGGGQFYRAQNATQLKNALLSIFENINTRNTSFSGASVNSLQTGSTNLTAILPRMSPQRDKPWQGSLYRFDLHNEFVLDQDHPGDADALKNDIYVVDTSGAIVEEDSEGKFIRKGSSTPATPRWEANARLRANGFANRKVYTTIDRDDDGVFEPSDNPPLEFKASNVANLINYLGIKGAPYCPTDESIANRGAIFNRLNLTTARAATLFSVTLTVPATRAELDDLCGRVLINFVRGQDLGDEDSDNNRSETRQTVLGDIFHSSPVLVTPPVDKFLCGLGFANQCVRTLYGHDTVVTPTPLTSYSVTDPCDPSKTITVDAYEKWRLLNKNRDRVVVVGANDGMLHVFHDGDGTPTCTAGKMTVDHPSAGSTGNELLAYIPPDLLPKLKEHVLGHTYMVDGDPLVRDIWADADNDGIKDCDTLTTCEFHTLVIGSEGRGGIHYFGIELRFDSSGNLMTLDAASTSPLKNDFFRWIFPQPNSKEAALMGKTLYALAPKPPPIGPMLFKSAGTYAQGGPIIRRGVPTHERWVAALSGGWSPSLERGRGIYIVDAWDGDLSAKTGRTDNLWWKFEYDEDANGGQELARRGLTYSVAAPVALVDYGGTVSGADEVRLDGFFDTAVFGDTGGQLWVMRMFEPGAAPGAGAAPVGNWAGARGFEMDRYGTSLVLDEDGVSTTSGSVANKWPFYYLPSLTIQPDNNALRVFTGTGNRYALLEPGVGKCRFDNPLACAKSNCSDQKVIYQVDRFGRKVDKEENHWKGTAYAHGKRDESNSGQTECGAVGGTVVEAQFSEHTTGTCENLAASISPGSLRQTRVTCGQRAADEFHCLKDASRPAENYENLTVAPSAGTLGGIGKNRYYGLHLYGGTPARKFSESESDSSQNQSAAAFDGRRLTDRTSGDPSSGNLVDVTSITCTQRGNCVDGGGTATRGAPESGFTNLSGDPEGFGWMLEYPGHAYKTSSGSSVLAGCVLWNDILPPASTGTCDSGSLPSGRIYQADFLTGTPDCAASFRNAGDTAFVRNIERSVMAPPPEPAMAVQVNSRGEVRYSAILVEPGQGDGVSNFNIGGDSEAIQIIYELPISRELHDCRHGTGGCVTLAQ